MIDKLLGGLQEVLGGRDLKSVLIKGASIVFVIRIGGAGLTYFSEIFLARILGPEVYGPYVYALSWAILLAIPAGLGFSTGVMRFMPDYLSSKRFRLFKGIIIQSWMITFGAGVVVAILSALVVIYFGSGWKSGIGLTLILGFGIIPFRALLSLQQGMAKSINKMVLAFTPQVIVLPILIVASIYIFQLYYGAVSITDTMVIVLGCYVVSVGGQIIAFLKNRWHQIGGLKAKFKVPAWLRVSLPLMLVSSFLMVIQRSDLILVGAMVGTEEAGIYNAASRTAALVSFILSAVNAIAAPTIARLYAQDKHQAMQQLAKKIAQYVFWPTLMVSIVLIVGSGFILSFFGSAFVEGKSILIILIFGQLTNASVGSVGYFMNMTGNQDQSAKVFGISAAINILLNIVGIYFYGAIGAAIATAISMVIWNMWLYILVKKNLNIDSSIFSTIK